MTKNTGIGYKKGAEGRAHVDIPENARWIKRSSLNGKVETHTSPSDSSTTSKAPRKEK